MLYFESFTRFARGDMLCLFNGWHLITLLYVMKKNRCYSYAFEMIRQAMQFFLVGTSQIDLFIYYFIAIFSLFTEKNKKS